VALTGPNGSGKTTLLRALAGLAETRGAVMWDGQALRPGDSHWIGTDDPLKGDLTVRENLRFWGAGAVNPFTDGLEDIPVRYLSRGQVRRVSLSRLFMGAKLVWLLDEPETGLDEDNLKRMAEAVRAHAQGGGVALIGTHRPEMWAADVTLDLSCFTCHPERSEESPLRADRSEGEIPHCVRDDNKRVGDDGLRKNIFLSTLTRDLRLTIRRPAQALTAAIFFILAVALMPLGLAPDPVLLQSASSGLIGMAALFAGVLASDRLFEDDAKDGTLDALVASGAMMPLYAAGRLTAAWMFTGLPLVMAGPVLGLMLGLKAWIALFISAALLPASILLIVLGGLCAALSGGARQGTVLLALLVMPLYSPVLIFTAGAMELQRTGLSPWPPVLLLWAMLAAASPLVMIACGAMLKARVKS
jgi:heme exporter protein B